MPTTTSWKTPRRAISISRRGLEWFLDCLDRAFDGAEAISAGVLRKARFWEAHGGASFNERQRLVLNRLLDGFEGKLSSSKWAKLTKVSQATAARDIDDLVERNVLRKDAERAAGAPAIRCENKPFANWRSVISVAAHDVYVRGLVRTLAAWNRHGMRGALLHIGSCGRRDIRRKSMHRVPGNVIGVGVVDIAGCRRRRNIHVRFAVRLVERIRWPESPDIAPPVMVQGSRGKRTEGRMRRSETCTMRNCRTAG